jgi:hypothetical protein
MSNGNGQRAKRRQEFFTYSTGRPAAAIAAGGTQTPFINIQSDADFVIEKLSYAADIAGAVANIGNTPVPNVNVLLTSTGSGSNLMNVAVPLSSLFGDGRLPFILPYPRVLPANSQLQITLTSFEAASTPFITLNFIGRKMYLIASQV